MHEVYTCTSFTSVCTRRELGGQNQAIYTVTPLAFVALGAEVISLWRSTLGEGQVCETSVLRLSAKQEFNLPPETTRTPLGFSLACLRHSPSAQLAQKSD